MRTYLLSLVVSLCALDGMAEMRAWVLADGRTFEAELSGAVSFDDNVKMIDAEGNELKVPFDQLSPDDRNYIDIKRVPKLDIDMLRSLPQVHFSSKVSQRLNEVRDPEIRASFGVRVKQVGTGTYDHELTAEIFVIGKQVFADRYILLMRESVPFRLNKGNGQRFEYESKKVIPLRDFYIGNNIARRGEKYHGYIILVTDELGHLVTHEESSKWLIDNVDNLKQLKAGNYLDQKCLRRYPARPDPVPQRTDL